MDCTHTVYHWNSSLFCTLLVFLFLSVFVFYLRLIFHPVAFLPSDLNVCISLTPSDGLFQILYMSFLSLSFFVWFPSQLNCQLLCVCFLFPFPLLFSWFNSLDTFACVCVCVRMVCACVHVVCVCVRDSRERERMYGQKERGRGDVGLKLDN